MHVIHIKNEIGPTFIGTETNKSVQRKNGQFVHEHIDVRSSYINDLQRQEYRQRHLAFPLIGKMETRVQMSGAEPANPSFVVIDFGFLLNEPKT